MALPAHAARAPGLHYRIDVTLDPLRHRLVGHETITYRSGADTTLHSIYLHAYPNAFRDHHTILAREGERWGEDYAIRFAPEDARGWMTIDSVTAGRAPASLHLDETIARIDLPRPLLPRDSVTLRLRFEVQVPKPFDRFGHTGDSYSMGQWYPKVAVYDDRGWHADPYHYFSEFYGDFGTFDVAITLPDRFWVGATGELRGATGGDNEIPLADRETARDSVTVRLRAVTADSLRERWPRTRLSVESDLVDSEGKDRGPLEMKRDQEVTLRVPRGAPVHYGYAWVESERESRSEADAAGRPSPLRLVAAARDTTVRDTIRALAAVSAPTDSVMPSLKTLHFHAERVHDFAWVASPDYVRADTVWNKIAIRALSFRSDQDRWSDQRAHVVSAMKFVTREAGPYIWPSFTSAESFVGGGAMEYPMLIMNEPDQNSRWFEWLDVTIAHELAHNWFYGMLGSDEREYPWLDEGFAQYMEHRYGDWKYPDGFFKARKRFPWMSPYREFLIDEQRYLSLIDARDEQPPSTPAEGYHGYGQYAVGAYIKPALMLRSLRSMLGEDRFEGFLHEYYRANLLRHPRPDDVRIAIERGARRDLHAWLARWISGTDIQNISVGGLKRRRIGHDHVATVEVRSRAEGFQPLRVEAIFDDGRREERTVQKPGRQEVTFRGERPVSRVTVDPWHEVIERNRLDNRTGFPPLRLKPLLDFPNSEAMTFVYGPMIWHGRDEGARLGLWTSGRYQPSREFPDGILAGGGNVVVGTRRGDFSFGAWGSKRVAMLGARGRLGFETARDAGLFRVGASAGNTVTAPGHRHPFREWRLSLDYRDRYDLAPVDPRYWSPGRALHGKGTFALDTKGPRRAEHFELDLRAGGHYERFSLEARQKLDLFPRGDTHFSWRFYGGSAFDRPSRELLFDVAEGARVDSIGRFYLNDRGPLLRSGHYWITGGGGLRGYRGRAALGKRVWGLNTDLDLPMLPVSLFADAGRIETRGLGESRDASAIAAAPAESARDLVGRTLADAGIGYVVGPVRITAPVWVGRPEAGEKPWHFRWLISIQAIPTPF